MATPSIPLGLMTADKDINQIPRFHSNDVLAACKTCEHVVDLPTASHGVMLSPLPPFESDTIEDQLLGDSPGFDRASAVEEVNRKVTLFFSHHLLP